MYSSNWHKGKYRRRGRGNPKFNTNIIVDAVSSDNEMSLNNEESNDQHNGPEFDANVDEEDEDHRGGENLLTTTKGIKDNGKVSNESRN